MIGITITLAATTLSIWGAIHEAREREWREAVKLTACALFFAAVTVGLLLLVGPDQ